VTVLASIVVVLRGKGARLASLVPIVAGLFVWHAADRLTAGTEAIPLPETTFRTLAGEELALTSRTGRPIVMNLWASWCPPCRREMPMMADIAASSPDVAFVFANQGENPGQVGAYLDRERLELPLILLDRLSELGGHYKAPGLPATLFIGSDGVLADVHIGEISREILIEKTSLLE
ncbi:TlpA family protein disulfide reductase, partial [Rhizobiaceae sp. 2RAB30]